MEEQTNIPAPPHLGQGDPCEISIDLFMEVGVQRLVFLFNSRELTLWLEAHRDSYIDPRFYQGIALTHHSWNGMIFREINVKDWNEGLRWEVE